MKNGYEYYYLFGLEIPLYEYGLGKIKQPKIVDFLLNDIDIEKMHIPFITVPYLRQQLQDEQLEIFNHLGGLSYLIFISRLGQKRDILMSLVDMLSVLYETKDVVIGDNLQIVINGDVIINSNNFDILSDIVLEMFMYSKPSFEEVKPKYKNKRLQETWEKLQRYRAEEAKKKELKMIDLINIMSHIDGEIGYQKIINLTMYQLKNSYATLMNQGVYNELMKYKTSGQFKFEKDITHWTVDSKVKKSAYSLNE